MFDECDRWLSGRTKFDIIYIVHELQTRRLMVTVKATASGLAVIIQQLQVFAPRHRLSRCTRLPSDALFACAADDNHGGDFAMRR